MSVGLDRTSVPMAEVTGPVALHAPRIRRPPPPVTVAYRMAYVATVSAHDRDGNVLLTQRFTATPTEGTDGLLGRIGAELRHLQNRYDGVPTTVVQDGAPELWNLIGDLRAGHGITIDHERIDRFHVDERLAAVCELVTRDAWTATQLRESWRACLDRSDTAVDRIIRRLDELLAHLWFGVIHAEPMPAFWSKRVPSSISDAALGLLSGHVEYLRGQRWFETGLSPCLFLRSLHLSERLRPCFEILQATPIASLRAA